MLMCINAGEIYFWYIGVTTHNKESKMRSWVDYEIGQIANSSCFFDELGAQYRAAGLVRDIVYYPSNAAPTAFSYEMHNILYATTSLHFDMVTMALLNSPNVYAYTIDDPGMNGYTGSVGFACGTNAHMCEVPFVISQEGTEITNTALESLLRGIWAQFMVTGYPGWPAGHYIGRITNTSLVPANKKTIFSETIYSMLMAAQCPPASYSGSCGYGPAVATCGAVKDAYTSSGCCGMPSRTFDVSQLPLSVVVPS